MSSTPFERTAGTQTLFSLGLVHPKYNSPVRLDRRAVVGAPQFGHAGRSSFQRPGRSIAPLGMGHLQVERGGVARLYRGSPACFGGGK